MTVDLTTIAPDRLAGVVREIYGPDAAFVRATDAWMFTRLSDGFVVTAHRSDVMWTMREMAVSR